MSVELPCSSWLAPRPAVWQHVQPATDQQKGTPRLVSTTARPHTPPTQLIRPPLDGDVVCCSRLVLAQALAFRPPHLHHHLVPERGRVCVRSGSDAPAAHRCVAMVVVRHSLADAWCHITPNRRQYHHTHKATTHPSAIPSCGGRRQLLPLLLSPWLTLQASVALTGAPYVACLQHLSLGPTQEFTTTATKCDANQTFALHQSQAQQQQWHNCRCRQFMVYLYVTHNEYTYITNLMRKVPDEHLAPAKAIVSRKPPLRSTLFRAQLQPCPSQALKFRLVLLRGASGAAVCAHTAVMVLLENQV